MVGPFKRGKMFNLKRLVCFWDGHKGIDRISDKYYQCKRCRKKFKFRLNPDYYHDLVRWRNAKDAPPSQSDGAILIKTAGWNIDIAHYANGDWFDYFHKQKVTHWIFQWIPLKELHGINGWEDDQTQPIPMKEYND